jgi:3-oxoacyl-[acyl-carrier protein] reductase
MKLSGKCSIVTGAGRGIGKAIAGRLLQEGSAVFICDLVEERTRLAVEELRQYGEIEGISGDVTDAAFCSEVVEEASKIQGDLDVLVNNAGTARFSSFLDHSQEDWDFTIKTNLTSVFLMGQRFARYLVERGSSGSIVNIASTNGHMAERDLAAYNASKAGVILLSKTMAIELATLGIRVNCVSPGFILTELAEEAGGTQDSVANYSSKIPMARLGEPREVADAVVFLASDEASFVTGESLVVDGGQTSEE